MVRIFKRIVGVILVDIMIIQVIGAWASAAVIPVGAETLEEDYVVANFGFGVRYSDDFEPNDNERTEISDEIVFDGSQSSMKWKSGNNSTCKSGNNRYSNFAKKDWSGYSYFNMWIYSEEAADDAFQIVIMKTALLNEGSKRYKVKLNFKGWRLISIPFDSFENLGDDNMNWATIGKMYFAAKETDRVLYFDRIWLSQSDWSDISKIAPRVLLSGVNTEYTPGDKICITANVFYQDVREAQLFLVEYVNDEILINAVSNTDELKNHEAQITAELTTSPDSVKVKVFVFCRETLTPLTDTALIFAEGKNPTENDTQDGVDLLDLNSANSIAEAGASRSARHTRQGYKYSALWRHGSSKAITCYGIPADLSAYDMFEMWIYAEDIPGSEAEMLARIVTDPAAPGTSSYIGKRIFVKDGWNHILLPISQMSRTRAPSLLACQYFQLTVNGWDIAAVPEAKFYIATAKMRISDGVEESYTKDALKNARKVTDIAAVIGINSSNVLKNGVKYQLSAECREINKVLYAPEEFFTTHMGISITSTDASLTVKAGNKQETVNIQEDPAYAVQVINGVRYFPAGRICELAGFYTYFGSKCLAVGGQEILDYLVCDDVINEVMEIVAYKTLEKQPDISKITEADWTELRRRWVYNIVGDDSIDLSSKEVAVKLASINSLADAALSKLKKGDDVIELFQKKPMTTTEQLSAAYRQIRDMAIAWGTYGSKYYHNEEVFEDIIYAMEWMYQNRYGRAEINGTGWRSVGEYNWWDWEISSPRRILDVMMIVYEHLDSTQIENWLALFHHIVPRVSYTGSNMLNLGKELIGAAILEKDANALVSARDAVNASFVYCDKGNNAGIGYYTDGSYRFHTHHAMNAMYGLEQIEYTAPLLSLLAGTKFEYTNPQVDNVIDWVLEGQIPFNVDGIYMRLVTGRYPAQAQPCGIKLVRTMIGLLDFVKDREEYEQFRSLIKYYVTKDIKTDFFKELTMPEGIELKKLLDDDTVADRQPYHLDRTFTAIDRTVHHRDDWAIGISMNSARIAGYESINGENRTGWYHGDGMYQVFVDADQYQYRVPYWASVNPYRIPGVTADTQERHAESVAIGSDYMSSQDFVGGVSLDETYGAAAMQLESYHNENGSDTLDLKTINLSKQYKHTGNLMAKKAWFMFDDEVVALGSDINASNDFSVETTVDNRILRGESAEAIYSSRQNTEIGEEPVSLSDERWLNYDNHLGYWFPTGNQDLWARRTAEDSSFFELWLDHGVNPQKATYEYVILPGMTKEQTEEYSKNPQIEVLANTEKVQAVRHTALGITAIVFWERGSFAGVEVTEPMMVMIRENNKVTISVSDPTQKLGHAKVTVEGKLTGTGLPNCVKTSEQNDKTVLEVNFTESQGRTIQAEFSR